MGRIKKVLMALTITIIISCVLIISGFGSAIFQEGNPVPLIVSAVKLHFSDSEYVQFAKTEKRVRFLSLNTTTNRYETVKKWMGTKGWDFKEQMGSGLIFTKEGEDAVVEVRQYSRNYFIWEIQKIFF
ncbi:hypothetical protein [Neobacillus kokaensis]|uniref:Uncharacterized protein n=1 Tax=Neobacillus kokaensis TaxID=2759023 RepID=A0ABQ3NAC9_9BACI|nr:hypothetical protein [Neobacillus kokaensis]GHH99026.1 hypothetical protein AM1BK_25690 [Neobacillus kokaensis]